MSRWQRSFDAAIGRVQWDDRHRALVAQPLFASCSRSEIRTLVAKGDLVEVGPGETILREDRIGYWFFVVLSGTVRLSAGAREVATVGPGAHIGEVAILGFGPQPLTATTGSATMLYVLGRRDLLHLAHASPGLRAGLFPGLGPDAVVTRIRELRAEGREAWVRLPRHRHPPPGDGERMPGGLRPAVRASRTTPFPPLAAAALRSAADDRPTRSGRAPLGARARAALVLTVASALTGVAVLYHPPLLVVRPDAPIDAAADIELPGRPRPLLNGRYLLTPVRFDHPNLFGAAWAVATRQQTLPQTDPPPHTDGDDAANAEREAFARAQRDAVTVAASRAGIDPTSLDVRFRSRDISGPSAGLIYTLALMDLLDSADLAQGRTIAATGALGDHGRVEPVAYVDLKRRAAARARVALFIVPAGQGGGDRREGPVTVSVASVDDALALLRAD